MGSKAQHAVEFGVGALRIAEAQEASAMRTRGERAASTWRRAAGR
jgi:hypothetical protein